MCSVSKLEGISSLSKVGNRSGEGSKAFIQKLRENSDAQSLRAEHRTSQVNESCNICRKMYEIEVTNWKRSEEERAMVRRIKLMDVAIIA